jgi:hypothetical protein
MSLQNLAESALYSLLPEGLISLDEQRLIQSVVGGIDDRMSDQRSYISKLEMLVSCQGLPETDSAGNPALNAVITRIQSPKGKVYNRSLDIHDDTPSADDPALITWAAEQLNLDDEHVLLGVSYGVDPLRTVDANILPYLASTVGAVLYQTAAQDPANTDSDARRLLQTWFSRLQIKGTSASFEALGRLLGFDDVRMTPLWSRLSPRVPNDIGAPENNEDLAAVPDFQPQQEINSFYDPLQMNDGPFFAWSGTATAQYGTNSTEFYTQSVNGFNPFFKVLVTGEAPTDPDSELSPFVLSGGGPETKAYVDIPGSGLRFEAIAAGESFNGMAIVVQDWNSGTHRVMSVTDRLSAIKYRSSFYDLALTMDFDSAEQRFGKQVVTANSDLISSPSSANFGQTAVSPFRAWSSGSIYQDQEIKDWTTSTDVNGAQIVAAGRVQSGLTDYQLNMAGLAAAGNQVVQAMEEVRPATRTPRSVHVGYTLQDQAGYANYSSFGTVTSVSVDGTSYGVLTGQPYPPYQVVFEAESRENGTVTLSEILTGESSPTAPQIIGLSGSNISLSGTFDYSDASWMFTTDTGTADSVNIYARFAPASTEVVRDNLPANADPTTIAVSSDGGWAVGFGGSPAESAACFAQRAVTDLVTGWNPDAYFYAGDNSQTDGRLSQAEVNLGPEQAFIAAKKFFVTYGNHDLANPLMAGGVADGWDMSAEINLMPYLPGNGRYYHVRIGHVELFSINAGYNTSAPPNPGFRGDGSIPTEPDGNWCEAKGTQVTGGTLTLRCARRYTVVSASGSVEYPVASGNHYSDGDVIQASFTADNTTATVTGTVRLDLLNSVQAENIKQWLLKSNAPWKVVMFHYPNEFSNVVGGAWSLNQYSRLLWPWKEWGVDVVINGHVHVYSRGVQDDVTHIIIGLGGSAIASFSYPQTYQSPYALREYPSHLDALHPDTTNLNGAMKWIVTPTLLSAVVQTTTVREVTGVDPVIATIDTWSLSKPEMAVDYQARPEDELDEPVTEITDDYPWKRDIVGGGELVDTSMYDPAEADLTTTPVGSTVAVSGQDGAQYAVTLDSTGAVTPRFKIEARSTEPYVPGQTAVAYTGAFKSLSSLDARQEESRPRRVLGQDVSQVDVNFSSNYGVRYSVDDMDRAMESGWGLYPFGIVNGVLVADPMKFNGPHHRDGLVAWYPMLEHPMDTVRVDDHAVYGNHLVPIAGFTATNRAIDADRGCVTSLQAESVLASEAAPSLPASFSFGFWIKYNANTETDSTTTILSFGPVSVQLCATTPAYGITVSLSGLASPFDQVQVSEQGFDYGWVYYAATWDAETLTFNQYHSSDLTEFTSWYGAGIQIPGAVLDTGAFSVTSLAGSPMGAYTLQDVRIWNKVKTQQELALARYHAPSPTAVQYRPAWLQSVNSQDRYGVRVLSTGYVAPDLLPVSIKTPVQAWVTRYKDTGEYAAQSRRKEVGLGSGNTPQVEQTLGLQWDTMTSSGTIAVSSTGAEDVNNPAWLAGGQAGQVLSLNSPGTVYNSHQYGTNSTLMPTGMSIPWPNGQVGTNPCRDRVWVLDDVGDSMYEVRVTKDAFGAPSLQATLVGTDHVEQLTGAALSMSGTVTSSRMTVSASHGTVYAQPYTGTVTSPPIYLYCNEESKVSLDASGVFSAWTDPTDFGRNQSAPTAALQSNGKLSFQVANSLPAGFYRLAITSGNIGQVDSEFKGFKTVITAGDVAFEAVLCQHSTGADFTATDTFEFKVPSPLPGPWILSVDWTNSLRDSRHGTARQLKITGIEAVLLNTSLYRLDLGASAVTLASLDTAAFPATPGGWVATITSAGTAYSYTHESQIRVSNETVETKQPLSNVLTSNTSDRTEDVLIGSPVTISDAVRPSLPIYSPIV